jgi:16S rRNA (guanine527-N7)-methyltransferase
MPESDSVSRETPPVPSAARGVFGARLELAERYAALLADAGVVRGLIGPREAPRLWERHLLNCAVLSDLIEPDVDVCDIGTGAGLPGIVLAIRRPDLSLTLVEPLQRRVTFLTEVVAELGLDSVEVVRARAEELHGKRDFSVVTSRAVAPLGRLLDWSIPLVRQGGVVVAMKGSSAEEEIRAAQKELRRHGGVSAEALTVGDGVIDPPTTVVRVEAGRLSRLGWEPTGADPDSTSRPRSSNRSRRRKGKNA